jgi:hypothetical protein
MSVLARRTWALLFLAISLPSLGRAQNALDGVGFYKSLEGDIRKFFDKAVADFNIAKNKRIKAGKIVVTPAMEREALAGIRMMAYNKGASYGICADKFASEHDIDKASASIDKCVEERNFAMLKASKLTDYINTVGADKMAKCELKARDFENETRFPPFEFLIDEHSPQLIDFGKLNECVMGGL